MVWTKTGSMISYQGLVKFTREAVFEHGNKLISMIGDRIPWVSSSGRKANAMVLWTKFVGRKAKLELRAQFFYLKPLR